MTRTVHFVMLESVVFLITHLLKKQNRNLRCQTSWMDHQTNEADIQEVCFFAFSYGLYQLLVKWTAGDSEPCSEHIPLTGPEVPSVVLLNLFQLSIVHPQLKAQFIPLGDIDENEMLLQGT